MVRSVEVVPAKVLPFTVTELPELTPEDSNTTPIEHPSTTIWPFVIPPDKVVVEDTCMSTRETYPPETELDTVRELPTVVPFIETKPEDPDSAPDTLIEPVVTTLETVKFVLVPLDTAKTIDPTVES